jgi:hypothetical protein
MNSKIAEILKDQVSGLSWIDKIAGLVRPVTYTDKAGTKKTMPVYYRDNPTLCDPGDYTDLVPDSSKMSILYFEDGGMDVANAGCMFIDITSSLKLVCWCNLKLINPAYSSALALKLEVIRTIPINIANTDWVTKINVSFEGEDSGDPFKSYTYDAQKQYMMWPFDYFALNYKVRFSIPRNAECYDDIVLNPQICP